MISTATKRAAASAEGLPVGSLHLDVQQQQPKAALSVPARVSELLCSCQTHNCMPTEELQLLGQGANALHHMVQAAGRSSALLWAAVQLHQSKRIELHTVYVSWPNAVHMHQSRALSYILSAAQHGNSPLLHCTWLVAQWNTYKGLASYLGRCR